MDCGLRRRDLGTPRFSWRDLRIKVQWLGLESALYRSRHPKSWSWKVDTEFLSAILFTLQGANWQRSGGKGSKPKHTKRPDDRMDSKSILEVGTEAKKKALDDEIARRRAMRERRGQKRKQKLIDRTPLKTA